MRRVGMQKMTVVEMKAHVDELIQAKFGLIVKWTDRPTRASATREYDEIVLPAIRSEISYAFALHEFGHFGGRFQNSRKVMVRERDAWNWAKGNARAWTEKMERRAKEALAWYQARHREFDAKRAPSFEFSDSDRQS